MAIILRNRLLIPHSTSLLQLALRPSPNASLFSLFVKTRPLSPPTRHGLSFHASAFRSASTTASDSARFIWKALFVSPGVCPTEVSEDMVLLGLNIVIGPYVGHTLIKEAEFVKGGGRAKDCPKDGRPEFAILGRSIVGKSSLINALVWKKEVALTSKKLGKTQLINHFLVNKSWYIVDLLGYE